jgi:hypothetical protein
MRKTAILAGIAVIGATTLLYLGIILVVGAYNWDDGAITLAYARTLAESGRFALTPLSAVSEGSSSLLFTFLLTGLLWLLPLGFYSAITLSQLVSLAFLLASALLLSFRMRRTGAGWLVIGLFLLLPMNTAEVINGMEMTAFGFLLLLYCDLLGRGSRGSLAVLPLLLLIRFEAAFYLVIALTIARWFEDRAAIRRKLGLDLAASIAGFLFLTGGRLVVFGTWLPNTVWAKMQVPYSQGGLSGIGQKFMGGAEFLLVLSPLVVAVASLAFVSRPGVRGRDVRLWLVLGFLLFAIINGSNWGYAGRVQLGLVPVLLVLLIDQFDAPLGRWRLAPTAALSLLLAACLAVNAPLARANLNLLIDARSYREMKAHNLSPAGDYAADWYGVTPENYKLTGEAALGLAALLGLERLKFAVPDVGGLGLCCAGIEVLDIGLLTNPELARHGFDGFEAWLTGHRPDLIEIHGPWCVITGIHRSALFADHYLPVIYRSNLFWLRIDHHDRLRTLAGEAAMFREVGPTTQLRYLLAEDRAYLATRGISVVLEVAMGVPPERVPSYSP